MLATSSIGIQFSLNGETRFYPFPMLETHEIVNDVVGGDAVLVTYCPLCGTGIVFDRKVGGEVQEFGVSGMLWQSNLLMYNRAADIQDRNLWSQVLAQAVVGDRAGEKLTVLRSDIQQFGTWLATNPAGLTLTSGAPTDPYNGAYYEVATNFGPNFDETTSELPPTEYVYGIIINGQPKAYPKNSLPVGVTTDSVATSTISITRSPSGLVLFEEIIDGGEVRSLPDVEGFWFSWKAAYPETLIWKNN